MKKTILTIFSLFFLHALYAQDPVISPSSGSVTWCPKEPKTYTVYTTGAQQTGCKFKWTVTNGTISDPTLPSVSVTWDDTSSKGTLSVTLTKCTDATNSTATDTYVIRSLKNETPQNLHFVGGGPYDLCSLSPISLAVDKLIVPNTGFSTSVTEYEADEYDWQLSSPSDWGVLYNGKSVTLTPHTRCASGTIRVRGKLTSCNTTTYSEWTSAKTLRNIPELKVTDPSGATTYTHSCSGGDVKFSANAISCATGYTWVFPAGWTTPAGAGSGITTGDPNITLRPPPPGTPASVITGSVTATANLNGCGVQYSSLTIGYSDQPLATPVFNPASDEILCSGASGTITVDPVPGAVSYSWYTVPIDEGFFTGNILLNDITATESAPLNTTSPSITMKAPTLTGDTRFGVKVLVRANRVAGCAGSIRNSFEVWVGLPNQAHLYDLFVPGFRGTNPVTLSAQGLYTFQMDPVPGTTIYNWTLPDGFSFSNSMGTSSYVIEAWTPAAGGTYILKCAPQGPCSPIHTLLTYQSLYITIPGGSGGGGHGGGPQPCPHPPCSIGPEPESVFPNPASTELTISFEEDMGNSRSLEINGDNTYEVSLYTIMREKVFYSKTNQRVLTIPLSSLPEGLYIVNIASKEGITRKQIQIKH